MGRKKTDVDQRILKEADLLFYRQGYANTGIQQIVQNAGTNKPGLYNHFAGKEGLAREYLERRNEAVLQDIIEAGNESRSAAEFFERWMRFTRDLARRPESYNGCPVANFALQTPADDGEMQNYIQAMGQRWQSQLIAYLRKEMRQGRLGHEVSAASLARQMLLAQQGAITMWKITGKLEYFDEAIKLIQNALNATGKSKS
ncbi:MAG: TetR/AcrR family transcriptional regulator [Leptospiraceae bacterium]|nr:TetR/AcrR family transcriptional regulator [Leptospiraceae bacterium]